MTIKGRRIPFFLQAANCLIRRRRRRHHRKSSAKRPLVNYYIIFQIQRFAGLGGGKYSNNNNNNAEKKITATRDRVQCLGKYRRIFFFFFSRDSYGTAAAVVYGGESFYNRWRWRQRGDVVFNVRLGVCLCSFPPYITLYDPY